MLVINSLGISVISNVLSVERKVTELKKHGVPAEVRKRWNVNMVEYPKITNVSDDNNDLSLNIPGITRQQVEQLLKLLPPQSSAEGCYNANAAMTGTSLTVSRPRTSIMARWIIDSGATNHMTCNHDWLIDIKPNYTGIRHVMLPTGQSSVVTHIGNCRLNASLLLRDVLLILKFRYNLISVSQLCRDISYAAVFHPSSVVF